MRTVVVLPAPLGPSNPVHFARIPGRRDDQRWRRFLLMIDERLVSVDES